VPFVSSVRIFIKRDSPYFGLKSAYPSSSDPQSLQFAPKEIYFSLLEVSRDTFTRLYVKLHGSLCSFKNKSFMTSVHIWGLSTS